MLDLIVNPISGGENGGKMLKNLAKIEARLHERNADYVIHITSSKGHAKTLTEELIEHGATDIICVGGDGTCHEVINGFKNFDKCNFGLIPCGTGNDFAQSLNLPTDVEKAVDLILDGTPKFTDYIQLPTVRCMNLIGMGMDVEVLRLYEKLKKKTKFGYTRCLLKSVFGFKSIPITVEQNGVKEEYNALIVCIGNGSSCGGGIKICPNGVPYDNKLNLVIVKNIRPLHRIPALLKLKKGKVLELPKAKEFIVENAVISATPPYTVQADGELYNDIPFEVKIVSNTLRMYR